MKRIERNLEIFDVSKAIVDQNILFMQFLPDFPHFTYKTKLIDSISDTSSKNRRSLPQKTHFFCFLAQKTEKLISLSSSFQVDSLLYTIFYFEKLETRLAGQPALLKKKSVNALECNVVANFSAFARVEWSNH